MENLDQLFGNNNSSTKPTILWNHIENNLLNHIDEVSKLKAVLIFKHSTRCIVSKMVLKEFEKNYAIQNNKIELYFLDLLNHRDLSNEIATKYQITHQSPQILVIKNGTCIYNKSHENIDVKELEKII